jgi:hypothetical protein
LGRPYEADRLFGDRMGDPGGRLVARRHDVRQDYIEPVRFEILEQIAERTGTDDDLHIVASKQWLQKANLEVPLQSRQRPDAEHLAPARRSLPKRIQKLFGDGKNGVSVVEGNAARLCEEEGSTTPFEQGMAQAFLKLPNLGRDSGL